jgi:hypothetical protein
VSAPIRAGGTGEVLYEQLGARRSVPARADLGEPIQKGEEVFVVRYEQGIAYVRRWEDLPEIRIGLQNWGCPTLATKTKTCEGGAPGVPAG